MLLLLKGTDSCVIIDVKSAQRIKVASRLQKKISFQVTSFHLWLGWFVQSTSRLQMLFIYYLRKIRRRAFLPLVTLLWPYSENSVFQGAHQNISIG